MTEKKLITTIVLLAVIVLSVISLGRIILGSPVLLGDEPYYHVRVASAILKDGFGQEDPLVYGGIPFLYSPYNLLLAGIGAITGLRAAFVIPFIVAVLTVICLYKILGRLGFEPVPKLVFICFYVVSPVFLYTTFSGINEGAALLLQLMGFLFYLKSEKITFASVIFFSLASLFGPAHMAVLLMLIGGYTVYDKKRLPHLCLMVFIFVLVALFVYLPQLQKTGPPLIEVIPYLTYFISDFGAKNGFSIFLLALAMVGFLRVWSKTKESYLLFSLILVAMTFFFDINGAYSNVIIVFIATLGFIYILKSQWRILALKRIAILLIVIGLISSTASYALGLIHGLPDSELIEAMEWLKQNSLPEDTVYSAAENGIWVEAFAERAVMLNSLLKKTAWSDERNAASNMLLRTYNLKKAIALLKQYNIRYILITLKDGKNKDAENGLYNLLNNNETFKKMYHTSGIRIYAVSGEIPD